MMKSFRSALLLLLMLCAAAQGCAYGIYEDTRLMDTMASDKAMATDIKTKLLAANFTGGMAVSVYCFYNHVFLVGEIPKSMQGKAIAIADSFHPSSVTPHWFSKSTGRRADLALSADLRTALIGTKGLSSTRIDTEVNADRVVLLGVVANDAEKKLAIDTARKVRGIQSVTSYLMLPPKP